HREPPAREALSGAGRANEPAGTASLARTPALHLSVRLVDVPQVRRAVARQEPGDIRPGRRQFLSLGRDRVAVEQEEVADAGIVRLGRIELAVPVARDAGRVVLREPTRPVEQEYPV